MTRTSRTAVTMTQSTRLGVLVHSDPLPAHGDLYTVDSMTSACAETDAVRGRLIDRVIALEPLSASRRWTRFFPGSTSSTGGSARRRSVLHSRCRGC
jgi:hypothetical protein